MLVVYGTLTLVVVPTHHHTLEYVDSPQYHSTTLNHGVECDLCTFSTTSIVVEPSTLASVLDRGVDSPVIAAYHNTHTADIGLAFSRRGPPAFLL